MRWFVPELYRFYDDQMFVLRLTFFWIDEYIDASDLLAFVPEEQKQNQLAQATEEAEKLMSPRLLGEWPGWSKQYEIPDVERFDIVFDPNDLKQKYVCSDAHWREYWVKVDKDEAAHCSVAAPKDAVKVLFDYFMHRIHFIGKDEPEPITNPLEEGGLVEIITDGRCTYDADTDSIRLSDGLAKAHGWLGKNAPSVVNAKLMDDGLSSDVLEG